MIIFAVEDEKIALEGLADLIRQTLPGADVRGFLYAEDVIEALKTTRPDMAFLDINLGEISGLDLAREILKIKPDAGIVFTTAYGEYAVDAFILHASGYILKPVTADKVRDEIERFTGKSISELTREFFNADLNEAALSAADKYREGREHDLKIRTFGNFECFIDGIPARFKYQKTKELLAYLVDRKGAMVGNGELITILWEDEGNKASYLKNLKTDLARVLEEAGYGDALIKQRGFIGIRTDKFQCDYYDLIRNRNSMLGTYWGEYMNQYEWSEVTHAYLESFYNVQSKQRAASSE